MSRTVTSQGFKWVLNPGSDDHLGPSQHEDGIVTIAASQVKGGVFIDVGAHVGLYSLRLAQRASKVIAVEANSRTFETLCENVILNDIENIEPRNLACWSESGFEVPMFDAHGMESGGSTGAIKIGDALSVGTAMTISLDDLILGTEDHGNVDLIKIDVEGAEIDVLLGAQGLLADASVRRPVLLIEMHDVYLEDGPANRRGVELLLEEAGYSHGSDIPYGGGYHWIARPTTTESAV